MVTLVERINEVAGERRNERLDLSIAHKKKERGISPLLMHFA